MQLCNAFGQHSNLINNSKRILKCIIGWVVDKGSLIFNSSFVYPVIMLPPYKVFTKKLLSCLHITRGEDILQCMPGNGV